MAAELDFFFQRYGWTLDDYLSHPRWVTELMPEIASISADVGERRRRAAAAAERARQEAR